jgi:phasin family protein
VADQLPTEVTESKAEVLPVVEPVKAAPAPVEEKKVAPAATAAAPKPQPAPRVAAKTETKEQPAAKAAAKTENKKQPARKAAAKTATRAKPAKKPVVARKAQPAAKPVSKATRPASKPVSKATRPAAKPVSKATRPAARPATKPVRAAAKVVRSIKTGVKTMANTTSKAAETGQIAAEQFRAAFGDINERAKAAAEKTAKIAEELADLTRGNVEALVASSKIAAKGVETMSQDAAEYSRKSFEEASAVLKSFAEVKSATDFFKLQGDFARSAFDAAVAESARVSETVLKLAGEVAEPINSRYTVAAERVKTLAA